MRLICRATFPLCVLTTSVILRVIYAEESTDNLVKLFHCCNNTDCLEKPSIWTVPKEFMSTMVEHPFALESTLNHHCRQQVVSAQVSSLEESNLQRNWLYPNGYLRVGKEFYANDEFCIESTTPTSLHLLLCPPDCGLTRPCIPKCCTLDKIYSVGVSSSRGCNPPTTNSPSYFSPPLYTDFTTLHPSPPLPHYYLWNPRDFRNNCFENKTTLFPLSPHVARNLSAIFNATFHPALNFRIRSDGALLYTNSVDKKCAVELEPKRVLCWDGVQDFGGGEKGFENTEEEYIVHLCTSWKVEHVGGHANMAIYGVLLLCASIFPLMTSGVYISLWRRQNVHGWTVAMTTGSLFLMYLFQGVALLLGEWNVRERMDHIWGCRFIAIVGHFAFLAAFSWMTVMCCDLWLTFRSITPTTRHSKGQQRFMHYSLFGFGLPTAFVGTGLILDSYYATDDCTPHLVPGYGQMSCWVLPDSQGVYFYLPIGVLFGLNFFFFGVTCFKLVQYRGRSRLGGNKKGDEERWRGFTRFAKLSLIMGLTWVFECISWAIDGLNMTWYWMIFDIVNILRAVGVFVVYVCKQDIVQMLEEKHPSLKKLLTPFKRKCSNDLTEATMGSTVNSPRILMEDNTVAFQMR